MPTEALYDYAPREPEQSGKGAYIHSSGGA